MASPPGVLAAIEEQLLEEDRIADEQAERLFQERQQAEAQAGFRRMFGR